MRSSIGMKQQIEELNMTHLRKKYLSVKVTLNLHMLRQTNIDIDELQEKLEAFCKENKEISYIEFAHTNSLIDDFGHEVRVISSDHNQLSEDAMKIKVIAFLQSQLN